MALRTMVNAMKLTEKVVTDVAGTDVVPLTRYLKGKQNVSEFIIARDLKQEINIIRNMLYRLLDANLVSFTRKKDKQKGWYIYYWTLKPSQAAFLYWDLKKKRLEGLRDRLRREHASYFFLCASGCIRLEFETAINFGYRCPECGELLEQQDNDKIKKEINREIEDLEKEIKKGKIVL